MHSRFKLNNARISVSALVFSAFTVASMHAHSEAKTDTLFDLSIKDLMTTKVTSASLFEESEIDAASSVSVLEASQWEKTGARRLSDALESVPSVAT
jgi:outer membrane receptor for ferrienterochelin and colicin